jgi:hypothetical protein
MAQRSTTAALNMALYYALLSFFFALYFQAQGEGMYTYVYTCDVSITRSRHNTGGGDGQRN